MTDNYLEHKFHDKYDKDCSSCFVENMVAKKTDKTTHFRRLREELGIGRNHLTDNQISPNPTRD